MVQQPKKLKTRRTRTKHDEGKQRLELIPRNDNQESYIKALNTSDQVIVFGPAGTGKTYVVSTYAADAFKMKEIDKIVITRPHVAVGRDVGYLPGTLEEKSAPWALPVLDVIEKHLGKGVVETALKSKNIEVAPLALMRGRSFEKCFVICDETQNITIQELKMLVTRIGSGSKLVLNGDIQQSDLKEADGLSKIVHLAKKHQLPIPIIEFGVDDIVRSDICRQWITTFMKEGL